MFCYMLHPYCMKFYTPHNHNSHSLQSCIKNLDSRHRIFLHCLQHKFLIYKHSMNVLPSCSDDFGNGSAEDPQFTLWRHILPHLPLVGAFGFTFGIFIILAWRRTFQKPISNFLFGAEFCRICFLVGELPSANLLFWFPSQSFQWPLHGACLYSYFSLPHFHRPQRPRGRP